MSQSFFGSSRRNVEFGYRRSSGGSRSSRRIRPAIERLEDRRMLTATLNAVSTTLVYQYTAASAAPSITGIDGALIFGTGGGESVTLGGGVAGAPIVNGGIVTNSSTFTKIEIKGPGGGTETFSILATGLNIGEDFQIDSTVGQASFAGAVSATNVTTNTATTLNGLTVTTSAGQSYQQVTLASDNTLTDTGSSSITFNGTVGGAFELTTSTGGVTSFDDSVTISQLDVSASTTTDLNGGSVSTTAGQSYGPVTLTSANTLSDSGSGITFNDTVGGAFKLTANSTGASGVTSFDDSVTISQLDASASTINIDGAIDTSGGSAGPISLSADNMAINAALDAGTNIVTLDVVTAGRSIDLGTNPGGVLGLTQSELNQITAGVVRIGDLITAGNITITAPLTDVSTGFTTLSLVTSVSGAISQNSGDSLTFSELQAAGAMGVSLNANNDVATLAGGANIGATFSFTDSASLIVDQVDTGLGSGFGTGIITGGPIDLTINTAGDSLTIDQPFDATHFGGSGGNITLIADTMALDAGVDAGAAHVQLEPFTSGRAIDVGHNPSLLPGELGLAQGDLDQVTAGFLRIGSSSSTGSIEVTAAITDVGTGWTSLSLISGSTISEAAGSITATGLAVQAASLIGLGGSNAVGNIAASSTSSAVVFGDSVSLAITTEDGVNGISAGAIIQLESTASNISLTVTQPVTTNGNQDITFLFDNITLSAAINAAGHRVTLEPFSSGQLINVGGGDAVGTLGLSSADLGELTADTLQVGDSTSGNITLSAAITLTPTLDLETGGGIVEGSGSLAVANLALRAVSGIGSAGAIDVIGPIIVAFDNSGSGDVQISSTGDLKIRSVDGLTSASNDPGSITLGASSPVTFAVDTTSAGTITATANKSTTPGAGDDVTVDADVTVESTGGDIDFNAGDNINLDTGSVVESDTGNVTLTIGYNDNDGSGGATIQGTIEGTSPTIQGNGAAVTINTVLVDFANGATLPDGLTVNGRSGGSDTLTISDVGDSTAHTYTVTATDVVRDGSTVVYSNLGALTVNGGSGGNTIDVQSTGTSTTINGGTGNDVINIGSAANSLSGFTSNNLTINGQANLATTTTAATGTPVAGSVTIGDTINLLDQGDTGDNSYTINASTIAFNGNAIFTFGTVETLAINTSTGTDAITESAAPVGVDHLIINGNSQGGGSPTSDTFNIDTSGSGTIAEVYGGAGVDTFNVTATTGGGIFIQGSAPVTAPGDTLNYDANSGGVDFGSGAISGSGNQTVAYAGIETVSPFTDTNGNITIEGTAGNDVLILENNGGLTSTLNGLSTPLPASTTSVTFTSNGGSDEFITDYLFGALPGDLTFNGGGSSSLEAIGNSVSTTALYLPSATTPGDGTITINGNQTITFSGLSPVDITGMFTATLNFPHANDDITIDNGMDFATGNLAALHISGTSGGIAFETVAAWNNGHLDIDTSAPSGNDTVTINGGLSSTNNSNISITTGTGNDAINVDGNLSASNNLTLQSGGNITLNTGGTSSANGTVTLTAAGSITEAGAGIISAPHLSTSSATGTALTNANAAGTFAGTNSTSGDINFVDAVSMLNVQTVSNTGPGNILIENSQALNIFDPVTTSTGSITLTTDNGSFDDLAAGTVTSADNLTIDLNVGTGFMGVTIDGALSATNALAINENTLAGGASIFFFDGSLAGDTVQFTGGAGDEMIHLDFGDGASLPDGISINGTSGDDSLTIDDSDSTTSQIYNVTPSVISGDGTAIAYQNIPTVYMYGSSAADTFNISPSAATTFNLTGDDPTPPTLPGDTLALNLTGITGASDSDSSDTTGHSGTFTFANAEPVVYSEMETLPVAQLAITTSTPATTVEGSDMVYTVTLTNSGSIPAQNVAFTDILPTNAHFISETQTSGADLFSINEPAVDSTTGTFQASIGSFPVGTATFQITVAPDEGQNTNSVSVTTDSLQFDTTNNSDSATNTVTDAGLIGTSAALPTSTEGASTSTITLGTFTDAYADSAGDPDGAAAFTASINWGNGSTTAGTVSQSTSNKNLYTITGSTTYTEAGTYPVSISVQDVGGQHTTFSDQAIAADATLTAAAATLPTFTVAASSGTITVATFTDNYGSPAGDPRGAAAFTAAIDWGDGNSSTGTISQSSTNKNLYTITSDHTYASQGNFTVGVSITDIGGSTASTSAQAAVSDIALIATGGKSFTTITGQSTGSVTVATFTDPGGAEGVSAYSASIDWGDGSAVDNTATITSLGDNQFAVVASHTYSAESINTAPYNIQSTVHHAGNPDSNTVTDTATVYQPGVVASGAPVIAAANPIVGLIPIATFTDPNGSQSPSVYTATINWGDGTSPTTGTISYSNGKFVVFGEHTYAAPGNYTPTITITRPNSQPTTVTASVTFSTVKMRSVSKVIFGTEDKPLTATVAGFHTKTTSDLADNYVAAIDWGNGQVTTGSVVKVGARRFHVIGDITYAQNSKGGQNIVKVTIENISTGAFSTVTSHAQIKDLKITNPTGATLTEKSNTALTNLALGTFLDENPLANFPSQYAGVIHWGDDSKSDATFALISSNSAGSLWQILGSHNYSAADIYSVNISIHDTANPGKSLTIHSHITTTA